MRRLKRLESIQEWKDALESRAHDSELVLLKTSRACGVSAWAERAFFKWLGRLPEDVGIEPYVLEVLGGRELSQYLARELGVRHESPQVIWLDRDLNVKWHASHTGINERALEDRMVRQAR